MNSLSKKERTLEINRQNFSRHFRAVFYLAACLSVFFIPVITHPALAQHENYESTLKIAPKERAPEVVFAENMARRGIAFLSNQEITLEERKADFRNLLRSDFDMNTIGRFAIGPYWRTMTEEQKTAYLQSFENYIVNIYSRRFQEYKGQKLEFDGKTVVVNDDVLVSSFLYPESGEKIPISWRVRIRDGQYRIIDIIINNISMVITQRSDFSSMIQRGGGDVSVLLTRLEKINREAASRHSNEEPSTAP